MSSATFAESAGGVLGAWESYGQVYFASIDSTKPGISTPIAAPGPGGNRKHPTLAVNTRGETLLAWTEGTGWQKGGALAWQVFDKSGRPTDEKGRIDGAIPVWSLATAFTGPDGGFTILH